MLLLRKVLLILIVPTTLSVIYLYSYPVFHSCGFPSQDAALDPSASFWGRFMRQRSQKETAASLRAPFRLLALGDPQLEGDTSIPDASYGYFPTFKTLPSDLVAAHGFSERLVTLKNASREVVLRELPAKFQAWRKQVDLFGNDYYLAHIYRTLHRFSEPTHVTVLGDLLGSQWIDDEEFEGRGWRFWRRVMHHGHRVNDEITRNPTQEILGNDTEWNRRVINVVGNHDVGYAGDMTEERIERFERIFGRVNWEIRFQLQESEQGSTTSSGTTPELRVVVLNSMNLDTPARNQDLQAQTYHFINDVIGRSRPVEDRSTGTILLTHIPLHKESGVCVDGPFFGFHGDDDGGGVKEQNHISYNAGKGILEGIYGMSGNLEGAGRGMGRRGIILTGHDHEGCDVYHHLPMNEDSSARHWNATRWEDAQDLLTEPIPGIREVTVRSMMGDFGGNAGLLSAWFDHDTREWQFAYRTCSIGVQHIWWAVHVLLLVTMSLLVHVCGKAVLDMLLGPEVRKEDGHAKVYSRVEAPPRAAALPITARLVADGGGNGSMKKRRRK